MYVLEGHRLGECSQPLYNAAQRLTLDILHNIVCRIVLLEGVKDVYNIGVVESCDSLSLLYKLSFVAHHIILKLGR